MRELDIVVVGAGIGGLGSALALARAGHRVTLVERDDGPMPDNVEDAFEWDRRGAPQVRHPHVFLGLAQTILRDHFPDVLRALSDLGVEPAPLGPRERARLDEATIAVITADRDLRMLPCRRTTFEWVMRRAVLAQPGVELRLGHGRSRDWSSKAVPTEGRGSPASPSRTARRSRPTSSWSRPDDAATFPRGWPRTAWSSPKPRATPVSSTSRASTVPTTTSPSDFARRSRPASAPG